MRLKEIEARLAQIRNELNTRAAELTAEEITALESEGTDLQEERTQILEQAERRNNLLARIAAGESIDDGQGGEGAAPRVMGQMRACGALTKWATLSKSLAYE